MKIKFLIIVMVFLTVFPVKAQEIDYPNLDSLVRAVTKLENEIYEVKLNLHQSQKQLKTGILVATVGYSVTILGGQLLGSNPDLGKALLYAGGAIGISGTVVLVKGFNKISIGPPRRPKYYGKQTFQ